MNNYSYSNSNSNSSTEKARRSYPFVHVAVEKQVESDENLMEALYVAGMPRTLVNRLASSFSRRLDE